MGLDSIFKEKIVAFSIGFIGGAIGINISMVLFPALPSSFIVFSYIISCIIVGMLYGFTEGYLRKYVLQCISCGIWTPYRSILWARLKLYIHDKGKCGNRGNIWHRSDGWD